MNNWRFKLLYDGDCPFCTREVRWLRRRNRQGHLAFENVTASGFDPKTYGATREELLGVIHGVFPDGRIVVGVEVFRQAYRAVGLGWIMAPTGWPVLRWLTGILYAIFARHRVRLGLLFGRSCDSVACGVSNRRHNTP